MLNQDNSTIAADHYRTGGALFIVLGVLLVSANLRAPITAVGPLLGEIRGDIGLSSVLAGLLTALPLITFAVLSPWGAALSRRFGMERTLWVSMIVLTAGILIRSVPTIITLFLGTILLGMAIAVCNVLLPSLIKRDFPQRIGLMTGVYSVSMSTWAALASGVSVPIAKGFSLGWPGALGCWAILSGVAIVVWLPRLHSQQLQVKEYKQERVTGTALWRSRLAWQVTLFMGLQSLLFFVTIAWLPEILFFKGMEVDLAGWMLSMAQFVSIPAMFLVPVLAGRQPNQRLLVILTAMLSFIGYMGLFSNGFMLITLSIILMGLGQGASLGLALSFFGLRTSNPTQAAELSGMAQSIGYLLAALGPILFGFLYDWTKTWTASLLLLLVASVCMLVVGLGAGRAAYVSTSTKKLDT